MNIRVILVNLLICIFDSALSLKTLNWIQLNQTPSAIIFILSLMLKCIFIYDIIINYRKRQKIINEPISDLIQNNNSYTAFNFTYFEISSDLENIISYSPDIINIFSISSFKSAKHLLILLKNQITNYTSVKEIEYDILTKNNFIIHTIDNQAFIINIYDTNDNSKKCIIHNISSYIKFKDNESLMNTFLYKILPLLSEYVEIHNHDHVYTNNGCGPIDTTNNSNIQQYHLSDNCITYVSASTPYVKIMEEFESQIDSKLYTKIINKINMKRIYKGQEFFNITEIMNKLYIKYNINESIANKCEIHGNKESLMTLMEFFLINGEIPMLKINNPNIYIAISSIISKNTAIKDEIINLLSFHSYEFTIEMSEQNTIYINLKSANFYLINTQETNS
jgi:hypothetical protein